MRLCVKLVICFAVIALLAGATAEIAYFNNQQQCSCCKGKCQGENNCRHADSKACLCSGKTPIQVTLVASGNLPMPSMAMGYLQKANFLYSFLWTKDIFHPPKA